MLSEVEFLDNGEDKRGVPLRSMQEFNVLKRP